MYGMAQRKDAKAQRRRAGEGEFMCQVLSVNFVKLDLGGHTYWPSPALWLCVLASLR